MAYSAPLIAAALILQDEDSFADIQRVTLTRALATLDYPGMAKTMVVTVTDDIDGSEGAETVSFSFAGQGYEIDLSPKNLDKFKKGLQPFIDAGRRVSRQSASRPARTRTSRNNSGAIRAWAAEQGLTVSERGRIPAAVVERYEAAH